MSQQQQFHSFTLPNGLQVVVQTMTGVQSAAMALTIPAGSVYDRPGKSGTAQILSEMFLRGAGDMDARQLSAAMDNVGLQRNVSGGVGYISFAAATTADRLSQAVPLIAAMVQQPHLEERQFVPARELVHQSLNAIEDEPRQRLGNYLRQCAYHAPWSNPAEGSLQDLPKISPSDVQQHYRETILPNHAAIGVAGNVDAAEWEDLLTRAFADWQPGTAPELVTGDRHPSPFHVEHDSVQTHIGLGWIAVPYRHPRYYANWAAMDLLGGGMSSRLFTEVREKRGLCYAVSASINTQRDQARAFGYAGTTNDRAQETLEVMVAEIRRLHEGISVEELDRCKARAKSALIMQQESTMSRAGCIARDILHLGRVTELHQVRAEIDRLTPDSVRAFLLDFPPDWICLATIGPEPLNTESLP
ncbi:MAG: insulinase family protein [Planctomycetaceae bacterium]|nr:insulinase family protein [Planctomycetaceae bacterium]